MSRKKFTLVIVESPYAGDVDGNIEYARACLKDCLDRGEAPYASHLLYTQKGVLDDEIRTEREKGIEAGLAWGARADKTVVYVDRGISTGMLLGIERAERENRPVEFRSIEQPEAIREVVEAIRTKLGNSGAQKGCL